MTLFRSENNRPTHSLRHFYAGGPRFTAAFAFAVVCASCATPDIPQHANTGMKVDGQSAASVNSAKSPSVVPGGMVIHIDPQTGALLKEPAPGSAVMEVSPAMRNAMSTSSEGLVVRKSSIPGGGEILDLQGRFQSPLIATIDANGKVKMHHPAESSAHPHVHTNGQDSGSHHEH